MGQIAVITGDLVGSSRHPSLEVDAAMQAIQAAAEVIEGWQIPRTTVRFTRFRGDGWQIYLADPRLSLRAAVVIQARLIALGMESRISIGVGAADSLGTADLSDAAGRAFELSGHGLDQMGDSWRLAIGKDGLRPEDQIIADLLGERMGRWTRAQAEAASLHLASIGRVTTLAEIGAALQISPQAANDRTRGAGSQVIASVLRRWEVAKARQDWDTAHD